MRQLRQNRALHIIVGLLLGVVLGWQLLPEQQAAEAITEIHDLDALRAQFNADQGQPRLILLLSPT